MEGRKAEKLFSLIYGLSLTIMKDIQGVFWGCPRIEALFWPGLGGYVTALTGRALDWQSRGQRFDPAYLHQKASKPYGFDAFFLPFAEKTFCKMMSNSAKMSFWLQKSCSKATVKMKMLCQQ